MVLVRCQRRDNLAEELLQGVDGGRDLVKEASEQGRLWAEVEHAGVVVTGSSGDDLAVTGEVESLPVERPDNVAEVGNHRWVDRRRV
ncbi:Os02g0464700 [Oryza sativa Japonica Group]|uniref:Os02g0464700 protein n=2 Tax=Oryza sativa subsp. japonica TaxID=39947 RepID=Q0E1B7_ORYSJ|nr:hypothetical protein EE612_011198 [Oryza sativa]KAF2944711.1 hypothetical protein DAI22_02g163300 [Oryza sativa Japonica Group]BAD19838.1 unknown protein [Oryza sativa Japonica Group]BAF08721.1 Os02g0464700 [Oryza sativa Japonica Group]BAS78578.1 Os02g0464700 [Oryza sativa Japonica Group]|eukprot:NP_001046807.1 Os02g0464700 [Oryza sativa Japonica Group]